LNPKILSGPPVKQKFGQGFPLYFTFSEWLKTKSISFILRIFTFLESQNIIWTPFQTHIGKVKYKENPCPNFLLKGDLKGGPDNILGFKKGKMLKMNEMLFYISLFHNAFHSF
jgi:hypothetical protein